MADATASNSSVQKKIIIVGDSCVGKTSMVKVYVGEGFNWDLEHPWKNYQFPVEVNGNIIEFSLVDAAGQEDYDRCRPLCYKNCDVVILVYSIESTYSLENIKERWIPEIKLYLPDKPIVLVGNQTDVRENQEALERLQKFKKTPITYEEGRKVSKAIKAYQFLECSAMTNTGIKEVVSAAANAAFEEVKPKSDKKSCNLQ